MTHADLTRYVSCRLRFSNMSRDDLPKCGEVVRLVNAIVPAVSEEFYYHEVRRPSPIVLYALMQLEEAVKLSTEGYIQRSYVALKCRF